MSSVIEKASKLVTPSAQEIKKLVAVAEKVSSRLKNVFSGTSPAPEINLGGSYARGTWLKGSLDIDYFIMYPPDYPREKLEGEAIKLARKALHGYRINLRFAEHPYVEGFVDSVRVNLVPCYKVPLGEWKSAADRSPYHTKYIVSKLDDKRRLEARLLKKFVKSKGVYGAEVRVQGFSGYVCEVLVLKYGSFNSVMEGLAKLAAGEVISLEPYDKDLAASFKSALVILDPVDTTRNLGTAISARNVAKLVFEARRYIANPRLSHFVETRAKRAAPRELLARTIVVGFKNKKRSPDILWGQLRKSSAAISNKLELMGFHVLRSIVASDDVSESAFLFLLADVRIGKIHSRSGPEYFRGEEVENYFAKNSKKALLTWIGDEGRIESAFPRHLVDATDALKDLLSKRLLAAGVSDEIKREMARGFRVYSGSSLSRKRNWLGAAVLSLVSEE
ncbi:MAG: CCA tRNA nucleotidyltransferase [Nitrososphaerales archaeon]